MKKVKSIMFALTSLLCITVAAVAVCGCGGNVVGSAPADFTINAKGEYSFTGVSGADTYVIAVYYTSDVKDGKIPTTKYVTRQSFTDDGGASKITGTAKTIAGQIGYNEYTAFVWGEQHTGGEVISSGAASYDFKVSGKLSDPELSASATKLDGKVSITDSCVGKYLLNETIVGFDIEIYNDEAMTDLVKRDTFGHEISASTETGPGASAYKGNSYTITYNASPEELNGEGELITPKKYYVRVKANGNGSDITESGWATVTVEITGKAGGGFPFPFG